MEAMAPVIGPRAHTNVGTHTQTHADAYGYVDKRSLALDGSLQEESNPPQERDLHAFL